MKEIVTGSITYQGRNTVTEYFKRMIPYGGMLNLAMAIPFATAFVWGFRDVKVLVALAMPLCISVAYTVYLVVQYNHYKNVVLTDVQTVVPRIGRGARTFPLEIEVTRDGETTTERTHEIFDGCFLELSTYTNTPQRAGYDEKRGRWVII
ncbi:MAG: hypothetical protein J5531_05860 [Lachnospiraceae bacterium]|nr:hypothetical protein [Lachnospiraceae bacterium]